jgi:hypothetical protein
MLNDEFSSKETDKFVASSTAKKNEIEYTVVDKLEINEKPKFSGLSKEEVLQYANDPKWVRIRWILFVLFWLVWIGLLVGAILTIVLTKKCPPKPTLKWWQSDCFYQIDVSKFKDSNGDGFGDLEGNRRFLKFLCIFALDTLFRFKD